MCLESEASLAEWVESSSDSKEQDASKQLGSASQMSTPVKFSKKDSEKNQTTDSLQTSLASKKSSLWTYSLGGFLVNLSVWQENAKHRRTSDGCGLNTSEPFARYDPEQRLLRTCEDSLVKECTTYSETLPASGILLNGKLYPRSLLVHHTDANVSSSWPTPTTADSWTDKLKSSQQKRGSMHSVGLSQAAQMWPTPAAHEREAYPKNYKRGNPNLAKLVKKTPRLNQIFNEPVTFHTPKAGDATGSNRRADGTAAGVQVQARMLDNPKLRATPTAGMYKHTGPGETKREYTDSTARSVAKHDPEDWVEAGGQLNPDWVEWLMGFPIGWTELSVSETQSCHKSQKQWES